MTIFNTIFVGALGFAFGLVYPLLAGGASHQSVAIFALLGFFGLTILLAGASYAAVDALLERVKRYSQLVATGDVSGDLAAREKKALGPVGESLDYLAARVRRELSGLTSEKEKLERVLRTMTDGVIVCDDALNVVMINRATERLLAIGSDTLGKPLSSAVDAQLSQLASGSLDTGGPRKGEVVLPGADGEAAFLDVEAVALLDDVSRISGVVMLMHDATETRRVDQVRSEFVANASHELKTPVANIQLIAETLVKELGDAREAEGGVVKGRIVDFAARLHSESRRLGRLTSDLLDLARAEDVPRSASSNIVEVAHVVESIRSGLASLISERGVVFQVDVAEGVRADMDEAQLYTVLFNLLENAIKYNRSGGSVTVRARMTPDEVSLTVSDEGVGIPEDELQKVFQRFYRVDKARSRETGGTGLGLSIVRNIVEKNGGRVEATSSVGRGSSFTLFLPIANLE